MERGREVVEHTGLKSKKDWKNERLIAPHANNNIYQWLRFLTTLFILYLLSLLLLLLQARFTFLHVVPQLLSLHPSWSSPPPNADANQPNPRSSWWSSIPFSSSTASTPLSISTPKPFLPLSVFWPPLPSLSSLASR